MSPDQRLPSGERLRRRREFLAVQQKGRKLQTAGFMVFVLPQRQRSVPTRLGVTVSKKIGNAVERNRVKRRVREAFRRVKGRIPAGLDVVFVARRNAVEVSFHQLLGQMEEMCEKHLLR